MHLTTCSESFFGGGNTHLLFSPVIAHLFILTQPSSFSQGFFTRFFTLCDRCVWVCCSVPQGLQQDLYCKAPIDCSMPSSFPLLCSASTSLPPPTHSSPMNTRGTWNQIDTRETEMQLESVQLLIFSISCICDVHILFLHAILKSPLSQTSKLQLGCLMCKPCAHYSCIWHEI